MVAADIASRVNRALAGGRLINGEVIEKEVDADTPSLIASTVLKRGALLTYAQVCLFQKIISTKEPELDTPIPDPANPEALGPTPSTKPAPGQRQTHRPDPASRPGSSPSPRPTPDTNS